MYIDDRSVIAAITITHNFGANYVTKACVSIRKDFRSKSIKLLTFILLFPPRRSPINLALAEKWSFVYPPTGFLYISQRCHSSLVPHLLFTSAALRILIGRSAIIFIHSCFNTGSIFRFVIAMFVSEVRFF